jgi:hypothetical protein
MSPTKTLMSLVAQYDSYILRQGQFAPADQSVRQTIKAKVLEAIKNNLTQAEAGALIMNALSSLPFTSINSLDLQMLSTFIYTYPTHLQFLKGELARYLQGCYMASFQQYEPGNVTDNVLLDTYNIQQLQYYVKATYKLFIIPAEARIKRSEEKSENIPAFDDRYCNILIRYNSYLNDDELAVVFEILCFWLSQNTIAEESIFEHLMSLMPRLSATQLQGFYEVMPKTVLSPEFSIKYKVPLFSFLMSFKDLPAAQEVSLHVGNELIHHFLLHSTQSPELIPDFIELIRKYHHGASPETMDLFVAVMMGKYSYNGAKRLETLNSIIPPKELGEEEDEDEDWIDEEDIELHGYTTLAQLIDILPLAAANSVGYELSQLHGEDWLTISKLLYPLGLSLAAFTQFIPHAEISSQVEADFTRHQHTPNEESLSYLAVRMDVVDQETQTRITNLLLAETTNNNPLIQEQAFDSLICQFNVVEKCVAAERIQDLFDDINRNPFIFGRQMLDLRLRSPVGSDRQRDEFIHALLRGEHRETFAEKLGMVRYSVIATKNKYPAILERLSEQLALISERQMVKLGDIQPVLRNILTLLFLPDCKKTDWKIDDTSLSLLTGVVEMLFEKFNYETIRFNDETGFRTFLIINQTLLHISLRISNTDLIQKILASNLSSVNNKELKPEFVKQICPNLDKPLEFLVRFFPELVAPDSSSELRKCMMKNFLKSMAYNPINNAGLTLANIIIESSQKESDLIELCKEALLVMNEIAGDHAPYMKCSVLEVFKLFLPYVKIEERFKLCARYTEPDSIQKALFAVAIKSQERLLEVSNATDITADICQIVIAYESPTLSL